MTVGLAPATANSYLSVFRGTAYTAPAGTFVELHIGDPGVAGTTNPSAVTTRLAIAWAAPSGGSMVLSSLAGFSMTTAETISHVAIWSASSAGTFLQSAALSASQAVINGSTLNFTTFTLAFTPIAA
ncbi:MAG: phage tail fiber protein [Pseudonocardiaceae bacterium]